MTYLKPENGHISAQQVADALRDDTILVSIMFANNETGDLLPVKEIGELLQDHQAAFHIDAVQAVGKVDVFPEEIKADFLSASAHKFHGPKGVGILYSTPQHLITCFMAVNKKRNAVLVRKYDWYYRFSTSFV